MIFFSNRVFVSEKMDMEDADVPRLLRTIRQFDLVNRLFSRSQNTLWKLVIKPNIKETKSISIVDVGAGGGDIMRGLALQCRAAKIPCHITLLDNDRRILDQTKAACEAFPEISVRPGTVWELNRLGRFDYVFCNHFLHHFSDSEIPNVLRTMYDAANGTLIVNDLRRSFFAYAAFTLFAGLFLHQSFAAYDGRLSIRKGFLEKELEAFAQSAGLEACAKITRLAPSRMLLIAVRPRPAIHSKQEMSQ